MTVQAMNLTKDYGAVRAVNNLSFTLEPGQVTGFLGPNGSGKSTTMRLMLGLDNGEGLTTWEGLKLPDVPVPAAMVGAHLDAKSFHPGRTARNHLRMLARASDTSNARIDEVLDLMGLRGVAKKRPKGFSLGMAQRLGLAGAILAEPKVLLLDEPAAGCNPVETAALEGVIRGIAAGGVTVVLVEHDMRLVMNVSDRIHVLANGATLAEGTGAEVRSNPAVIEAYLGVHGAREAAHAAH